MRKRKEKKNAEWKNNYLWVGVVEVAFSIGQFISTFVLVRFCFVSFFGISFWFLSFKNNLK
jgi:hypothetical protein